MNDRKMNIYGLLYSVISEVAYECSGNYFNSSKKQAFGGLMLKLLEDIKSGGNIDPAMWVEKCINIAAYHQNRYGFINANQFRRSPTKSIILMNQFLNNTRYCAKLTTKYNKSHKYIINSDGEYSIEKIRQTYSNDFEEYSKLFQSIIKNRNIEIKEFNFISTQCSLLKLKASEYHQLLYNPVHEARRAINARNSILIVDELNNYKIRPLHNYRIISGNYIFALFLKENKIFLKMSKYSRFSSVRRNHSTLISDKAFNQDLFYSQLKDLSTEIQLPKFNHINSDINVLMAGKIKFENGINERDFTKIKILNESGHFKPTSLDFIKTFYIFNLLFPFPKYDFCFKITEESIVSL